jgi:protein-tyrosine kinase
MNSQIFPLPNRAELDIGVPSREAAQTIGALLVGAGKLEPENVQRVLDYQRKSGLLFGEAGIAMGLLNDEGQLMLRWFENDARQAALAIVSPGSGEGRSYITANLAVLFSQMGKRTLLIDADLRRPRQHRIFGLAGRIGLSSVLAGRAGWDAVTEIKALPGLWVLPAGAAPPNPQELLARPGFGKLIQALRTSYEVILIDTPAAGQWADASTIATRAGAALMLACRDATSVPRISKLGNDLRQFGVTIVGAVLNGSAAAKA